MRLLIAALTLALPSITPTVPGPTWVAKSGAVRWYEADGQSVTAVKDGMAMAEGLTMKDGVIQFEMRGGVNLLAGIAFRMQSAATYDIVYFSANEAGQWSSVQYQPVYEGATTWQLYPDELHLAELPAGPKATEWTRVKLDLSGSRVRVWLGDAASPVLDVPDLKRAPESGSALGLWSVSPRDRGNEQLELNVRGFTLSGAMRGSRPAAPKVREEPDVIRDWRISGRIAAPDSGTAFTVLPDSALQANWWRATPESSGIVNLTRELGNPGGAQAYNVFGGAKRGTALAYTIVESSKPETRRLELGYSDEVSVFLDGRLLYSGNNAFGIPGRPTTGRNGGGRVQFDNAVIDVPLTPGSHYLVLAVTDKAFGWGFKARWGR